MRKEIDEAIKRVLDSGQFILGEEVAAFEREFAEYRQVDYAIGVGNGTEALYIALRALDIGPGDEVITVSHTSSATACAIMLTGARPVYVDIEEDSMLMNVDLIEAAITPKTRAILPVHLYGRECRVTGIKEIANKYGMWMVEDCAQSAGNASYLYGDIGCYSFYPTKNLGGIGDGGCLITRDIRLMSKIKRLRQYGYGEKFVSNFMGINSRLDEIQAAVLRVKLGYLDEEIDRRKLLAGYYSYLLKDTCLSLPQMDSTFHQYVVRCPASSRNALAKLLNAQIHYPVPCHMQPAYANRFVHLPVTERVCKQILSLPMRIKVTEAPAICDKIKEFLQ